MKTKRVLRYYCDFCKKSGCSRYAIEKHEKHCTMNPQRACRMCGLMEGNQNEMKDLLALLPDPKEFEHVSHRESFIGGFEEKTWPGFDEMVKPAILKLREATDGCPACILAALRQKGIIIGMVAEYFDYGKECAEFWKDVNADKTVYDGSF